MQTKLISRIYLILVPFLSAALAFIIGHVSYRIYLPVWIIHACLTCLALYTHRKYLPVFALLLIIPWIFISIFAGMGPPPHIPDWVLTATEQQIRYNAILVISSVLISSGFALLREELKAAGENVYSLLGMNAIRIVVPLFIINMLYWGSFLTQSFRMFVASQVDKRPDWYLAMREMFGMVSTVEVGLTYLATAAFATSLKKTGRFSALSCNIYIIISFIAFAINLIPEGFPEPLVTASYVVSIPAFPFIMPYLMGINLLKNERTLIKALS